MNRVFELNHVIVKHYLSILRDKNSSTALFRDSLDKLGLFLAMELTAGLTVKPVSIQTPLVQTETTMINEKVAVVPIL